MMDGHGLSNQDGRISSQIIEIGCMCTKCNCKRVISVVVSICDSCIKGNHLSKIE